MTELEKIAAASDSELSSAIAAIEGAPGGGDAGSLLPLLIEQDHRRPDDPNVLAKIAFLAQQTFEETIGIRACERLISLGVDVEWAIQLQQIFQKRASRLQEALTNMRYAPDFDPTLYPKYPHVLQTTADFIYIIDVVGTCNLRCPSCPVGNDLDSTVPKGFMPVADFQAIIDKIRRDAVAATPLIWLFNWGEPLLHPHLPEILEICNAAGMRADISSNLNTEKSFRDVVRAAPQEIKISLSGYTQPVYGKTHKNGNIALVKSNMHRLAYWIDRYKVPTRARIDYHLYKGNQHEVEPMRALAAELGFAFDITPARYQPIEKVVALREGRLDPAEKAFIDENLLMSPAEYGSYRLAAGIGKGDCELRYNMMSINWDGTVTLCCGVSNATTLGVKFVDHSHEDLQRRKYKHSFCATCYQHGLAWTSV